MIRLALLAAILLTACGASDSEVRQTACTATRLACTACEAAQARYCGGEEVTTEVECTAGGEGAED